EEAEERANQRQQTEPVAATGQEDSTQTHKITIKRGGTTSIGPFDLHMKDYEQEDDETIKDSTLVAVRASIEVIQRGSDSSVMVHPLFSIYQKDGKNWSYAPPVRIPGNQEGSIQFSSINPATGEIELTIRGVDKEVQEQWVLLVAEEKPYISVVWFGTFLLMGEIGRASCRERVEMWVGERWV